MYLDLENFNTHHLRIYYNHTDLAPAVVSGSIVLNQAASSLGAVHSLSTAPKEVSFSGGYTVISCVEA